MENQWAIITLSEGGPFEPVSISGTGETVPHIQKVVTSNQKE
jgi:hypothetical protein